MNLKKGLWRLTWLLSIVVGVGSGLWRLWTPVLVYMPTDELEAKIMQYYGMSPWGYYGFWYSLKFGTIWWAIVWIIYFFIKYGIMKWIGGWFRD